MKKIDLSRLQLLVLIAVVVMSLGVVAACGDDDDDDDNDDDDILDDDDDDMIDDDDDDMMDDDDDDDTGDDDTVMEESYIRALHLSPNAGLVDVWVDNALEFTNDLEFKQGTTYGTVEPGDYTINIVPAGGDPATDSVFDIPISLEADTYYTAVVYGAIQVSTASGLAALLVEDTMDVDAADIRVFVGHTADGVGEVDIWNIPGGMDDPFILLENVGYGVSAFLPTDLPAGAYTLGFDADNNEIPDFVFELPSLDGGSQYNVFAVFDDPALFLIAQLPDGSTAQIDPLPVK